MSTSPLTPPSREGSIPPVEPIAPIEGWETRLRESLEKSNRSPVVEDDHQSLDKTIKSPKPGADRHQRPKLHGTVSRRPISKPISRSQSIVPSDDQSKVIKEALKDYSKTNPPAPEVLMISEDEGDRDSTPGISGPKFEERIKQRSQRDKEAINKAALAIADTATIKGVLESLDYNFEEDLAELRSSQTMPPTEESYPFGIKPFLAPHVEDIATRALPPAEEGLYLIIKEIHQMCRVNTANSHVALNRAKYLIGQSAMNIASAGELFTQLEAVKAIANATSGDVDIIDDRIKNLDEKILAISTRTQETHDMLFRQKGKAIDTSTTTPAATFGQEELRRLSAAVSGLTSKVDSLSNENLKLRQQLARESSAPQPHPAFVQATKAFETAPPRAPSPRVPTPRIPTPKPQSPRPPTPKNVTFAGIVDNTLPPVYGAPSTIYPPLRPEVPFQGWTIPNQDTLQPGARFFNNQVESFLSRPIAEHGPIHWWAKVVSWGGWGPLKADGKPEEVSTKWTTPQKMLYLKAAIARAFQPKSYKKFLLPPLSKVTNRTKSIDEYGWNHCVYSGLGSRTPLPKGTPVEIVSPPVMEEVYYEDLYQPTPIVASTQEWDRILNVNNYPQDPFKPVTTMPEEDADWTHVQRGNKKRTYSSVASNVSTPVSAPTTLPTKVSFPKRPRKVADENPTSWIVRFSGTKPDPTSKLTPFQIVERVNELNRSNPNVYRFRCLTANWTKGDNITLRFSNDSKDEAIEKAQISILEKLNHNLTNAKFGKNLAWSKITIPNVPCRQQNTSAAEMHTDESLLWTNQQLETEIRANPRCEHLIFTQAPNWTKPRGDFKENELYGTVCFSFEDPDGTIANQLCASRMYMFAQSVIPRPWKEKVNLRQCTRCWVLGTEHEKCTPLCRICASSKHIEEDHNRACGQCQLDYGAEAVQKPTHRCPHTRCRNCNQPHFADDLACRARSEKVQSIREKSRGKISSYQPILDLIPTAPRSILVNRGQGQRQVAGGSKS